MTDGIGTPYDSPFAFSIWPVDASQPVFPRYPECPPLFGCAGHVDPSELDTHDTHWERFGPSGVVVTLTGAKPPMVSTEGVRTIWAPEHALLYAAEITHAAQFAQQYAWATAMGVPGARSLRPISG